MTIKIGIPVSLTGQFSLQGRQTLTGLQAWAADLNRNGGLQTGDHAAPVTILWRDDASRPANARQITAHLIDHAAADLIIGPYSAALTRAAVPVAQARHRLLWNQGGASPALYRQNNPWIVGILTPADQYLTGLLSAVRETQPNASRVAIIRAAAGEFPREIAAGLQQTAPNLGFRITQSWQLTTPPPAAPNPTPAPNDPTPTPNDPEYAEILQAIRQSPPDAPGLPPAPNNPEYAEILQAIRQSPPDVLVIAGRFQQDLQLAAMLAQSPPPLTAVAVIAAGIDAFRQSLGHQAENFIGPSQWEPAAPPPAPPPVIDYGPTPAQVQASLRRAGCPAPDYPAAQAYAAGIIIQRCAQAARSLNDHALRQAAASLDFTTFYGRFRIDPTGRPTGKPALLTQWRHGQKTIIWPPQHRQQTLTTPWR